MLARLLLTILKHNPLQSKWLRISNGRRGARRALDVKKKSEIIFVFAAYSSQNYIINFLREYNISL